MSKMSDRMWGEYWLLTTYYWCYGRHDDATYANIAWKGRVADFIEEYYSQEPTDHEKKFPEHRPRCENHRLINALPISESEYNKLRDLF